MTGMTRSEAIGIAKAQLWEEAKGKMRAMVAVEGQCSSHGESDGHRRVRWRTAQTSIETFIRQFEDEGLHE